MGSRKSSVEVTAIHSQGFPFCYSQKDYVCPGYLKYTREILSKPLLDLSIYLGRDFIAAISLHVYNHIRIFFSVEV